AWMGHRGRKGLGRGLERPEGVPQGLDSSRACPPRRIGASVGAFGLCASGGGGTMKVRHKNRQRGDRPRRDHHDWASETYVDEWVKRQQAEDPRRAERSPV